MPYSPTTWVDDSPPGTGTLLNAANLNHMEAGIAAAVESPAGIAAGEVPVWNGSAWVRSSVTKIATGMFAGIKNADIDAAAAIALSKLGITGTPNGAKYLRDDGTWATLPAAGVAAGAELDRVNVTADAAVSATTEGTANTLVAGTSLAYDATKKNIVFFCPRLETPTASNTTTIVFLRGATVIGQIQMTQGGSPAIYLPICVVIQDTPSAATFAYSAKAFTGSGTQTFKAGAGGSGTLLPMSLTVTKA